MIPTNKSKRFFAFSGRSGKKGVVFLFLVLFGFVLVEVNLLQAQDKEKQRQRPDPTAALWRSAIMPGWGHYYVNSADWTRGKFHLVGEVILITSLFGLHARAGNLEGDLVSFARAKAGTDISGRSRGYRLAIGNFENRRVYNEYHRRVRNWGELYPDQPRYEWQWVSREARSEYTSLRERIDRINQQLPALITLMVVNRVVSGLSAYLRARDRIEKMPKVGMAPTAGGGMATRIQIPF